MNSEGAVSVIGADMRIIGDIESNGVVKVEGVVEGSIRGARQVLLGRSGVIHGDVQSGDAIIGGKIVGTVVTSDRVEVQGTASVEGDVHTRSIVVFEGAMINGNVRVGEGKAAASPAQQSTPVRLAADS